MIIRKLRLKHGWSQEQLSQLSGISTRTIQRIEQGQKASLESLKSLAAVFEVNFDELQQEAKEMNTSLNHSEQTNNEQSSSKQPSNKQLSNEEILAMHYVNNLKKFYIHLITFVLVMIMLFVINYVTSPNYIWAWWVLLGWGLGVAFHAVKVFYLGNFFGPEWEKRQVEKHLGRKL